MFQAYRVRLEGKTRPTTVAGCSGLHFVWIRKLRLSKMVSGSHSWVATRRSYRECSRSNSCLRARSCFHYKVTLTYQQALLVGAGGPPQSLSIYLSIGLSTDLYIRGHTYVYMCICTHLHAYFCRAVVCVCG